MNDSDRTDPVRAWIRVIAVLTVAADIAPTRGGDPALHSLTLGAQIVASRALAILPREMDGDLEDVVLDVAPATTVGYLIRAAGATAPRDRIERLPAEAAAVIAALDALVVEAEGVS